MSANVETMFYRQETPWHGLGTRVEDYLTAAEAITAAGLDWTVSLRPVEFTVESEGIEATFTVPDKFVTVRSSDLRPLGVVGKNYKVLDNVEAFDFADDLLDDAGAKYETAGSLRGGQLVWLLAKMPQGIQVAGEDAIDVYLLVSTSHDGTASIKASVTPVRVVCQNTLNLALREADQSWSIRHTNTLDGRLAEARESLSLTTSYMREFEDTANALVDIDFNLASFTALTKQLTKSEEIQNKLTAQWVSTHTLTDDLKRTGWGAVNVIGEYFEHGRKGYKEGKVLENSWFGGDAAKARDKATMLLLNR